MLIKKLTLTNFRAYIQAEFDFQAGLNLLVGINGVGKTSVLDALRICLSIIYPEISKTKQRKESFKETDIKIGSTSLQMSCDFSHLGVDYNLLIVKRKENIIENKTTNIREQVIDVPDQEIITPKIDIGDKNYSNSGNDPIGVFFSTKRSLVEDTKVSKTVAQAGQAAAHAEALSENRVLNLRLFTDWYRAQKALSIEDVQIGNNLTAIQSVVESFLPGFHNLRAEENDGKFQLWIDKNGIPLTIYQLSDGERGMLAVAIDIARRLVLANPVSENPVKSGDGIVFIDELDLHLHPKWQRSIAYNLVRIFPNCQFIATTHSPQIIPSLAPEKIQFIDNDRVFNPERSLGVDTNWILKYLMDTNDRPAWANEAITKIEDLINEGDFEEARRLMTDYKNREVDLPEWASLEARIARLEIIEEDDEEDK
ncbi:AAA family ATPase [Chitinophaga sp. Mgbs1]|uniref:AAA family ATPase n=1 Tax=Chitinophaga solisilvae TaxID=1233460 RepID=A0A433WB65_9BACT|nr:AAA family ATPase [Chitinophaga solisilvae]